MATIMRDVMARQVTVKENGRPRQIPFREAFIHKLVGKTLEGGTRDMIALMKAMHDYMPEALIPEESPQMLEVRFVSPDGKRWRPGEERPEADHAKADIPDDELERDDVASQGA
jgi:hypothetical protein